MAQIHEKWPASGEINKMLMKTTYQLGKGFRITPQHWQECGGSEHAHTLMASSPCLLDLHVHAL